MPEMQSLKQALPRNLRRYDAILKPSRLRQGYPSLNHLQERCRGTRNGERTPC